MASLNELRAKLAQQNQKQEGNSSGGGDNTVFPHWNIKEGETATVRFLPDADTNNTFFWVERNMIKLPFAGIKGEANSKEVFVQVPCMEMWGETCPILTEVRPWFKDKSLGLEDLGRKYWKKKSYLFQGTIVDSPLKEDKTPDNPIRRFVISPQIFNVIKAALMDPDMEELPTDYLRGIDFKIVKGGKGGYADYSASNWARRERSLSAVEQQAIDQYGLFDLKTFLPKKPGAAEVQAIKEMFEASFDGEAYDPDRWGQFYRPSGVGNTSGNDAPRQATAASRPTAIIVPAQHVEDDEPPFEVTAAPQAVARPASVPTSTSASDRARAIIEAARNRQK